MIIGGAERKSTE